MKELVEKLPETATPTPKPKWVSYLILVLNSLAFILLDFLVLKLIFRNSDDGLGALFAVIRAQTILIIPIWAGSIISYFVLERKLNLKKSNLYFLILIFIAFPLTALLLIFGLSAVNETTQKMSPPATQLTPTPKLPAPLDL